MRSIIKSVHPKACERIMSGEQTIIVAKSVPKEVPFKAYIYCTKKPVAVLFNGTGKHISEYDKTYCYNERSGKVIGEFICDKVDTRTLTQLMIKEDSDKILRGTCLSETELFEYLGYKRGMSIYDFKHSAFCLLHISDLKIYDKPKELGEFRKVCVIKNKDCANCEVYSDYSGTCINWVTRPPQSWQYVEEL